MPDIAEFVRLNNAPAHLSFVADHHDTYPYITPTGSELSGKSILITGASKGIGRTTAIRCTKAGCSRIVIAARSQPGLGDVVKEIEEEARKSNLETPHILPLQVDVTSDESVRAAAKVVDEAFGGKLDILVNNAGYLPEFKTVIESDPAEWVKGWDVNVKGTFLCCHYFLPFVLKSETKLVINLSSVGAHTLTYGGSSYQASRFANCRLTEFLARDHEDENLIAISVHPGGIKTDMRDNFPEMLHSALVDEPALPADAIIWLAKERREWLNGRFVCATWDMEELEGKKNEVVDRDLFKFRITV
ncbi:Glucose/ribitol dehydrogenase [Penicillium alfredii]|uniref:Glucose/ribitol dehydrogenase n=1 Tax=Penicillium alfredii TaxID=1506179 RepID=A0A9W9FRX4_9EURO|nr:Glucose/ribitol dehydrogenase [Penicillium alfredii]KAJ5105294.1 Glucose/ribitol dehydrogenase [Penicillium alfredii]